MVKSMIVSTAVAVLALGWASSGEAQLSPADREFMNNAAAGGAAEVEMGRLAASRASSDAVKQFGQRMATDHGAANAQLAALASRKGVQLTVEPAPQHRAMRDQLAARAGQDFDRAYMLEMVRDHDKDVAEFERAMQTVQDAELRAWVAQTLPVLRTHQQLAHQTSNLVAGVPAGTVAVVAAPSALPGAVVVVPGAATPWCQGAWRVGQGTNFGVCAR